MAWQLVYTSAPRGLIAGRSGFCTVARHAEIRDRVVAEVERYSAYDRVAATGSARGQALQPIIASHRILDIAGTRYHLLSRVRDAGLDYTGRTSHIAHHIICEEHETHGAVSPASILRTFPWYNVWNEPARHFTDLERVDLQTVGKPLRLPAQHWRQLTGRADNAALLVEHIGMPGCSVLCAAGSEDSLLCLFEESLQLLNVDGSSTHKLWSVRFTTFLQASENSADFDWRGGWAGFATAASDRSRGPILDTTRSQELPYPKDPALMRYAETGVPPALPRAPKSGSGSARITFERPVQSQGLERGPTPAEIASQHQQVRRRNRLIVIGSVIGFVVLLLLLLLVAIQRQQTSKNGAAKKPTTVTLPAIPQQSVQTKAQEKPTQPKASSQMPSAPAQSPTPAAEKSPATTSPAQPLSKPTASSPPVIAEVSKPAPQKTPEPATSPATPKPASSAPTPQAVQAPPEQPPRPQSPKVAQGEFDSLPKEPTYLVLANLAQGVDLHELFDRNVLSIANKVGDGLLQVKADIIQDKSSWDHFPDANKDRNDIRPQPRDKETGLYQGFNQIARLTETGSLSPMGNASWRLAAFRFQRDRAGFQVLLMEKGAINAVPFPPLLADQNQVKSYFSGTEGGKQLLKTRVEPDFLRDFKIRSFPVSNGTKVRLCSSKLGELFSQNDLNQQSMAILKDQGAIDGDASIDCDALDKLLKLRESRFKSLDQPPSEPLPNYNKVYLNQFSGLKSFLQNRKDGFTVNPWADCMDYLGQIAGEEIGKKIEELKHKLNPQKKNNLSRDAIEGLREQLEDLQEDKTRLPDFVEDAKTDWGSVCTPNRFWSRHLPLHLPTKDFKQDVSIERKSFEATKEVRGKPKRPDTKAELDNIEKIRKALPKQISDLGNVTLEMEVAPNTWWPVVKFVDGKGNE